MTPNISEEAVRFLRRRLPAMLGDAPLSAKMIAENVAFGAAVLGAGHVELVDHDGWWFVASELNWLRASKAHAGELELFERIVRFPEQSASGHRAEIYVTAYARDAYFRIGDAVTWLRGEPQRTLPDAGVTPPWCRNVLAFRLPPGPAQRAEVLPLRR